MWLKSVLKSFLAHSSEAENLLRGEFLRSTMTRLADITNAYSYSRWLSVDMQGRKSCSFSISAEPKVLINYNFLYSAEWNNKISSGLPAYAERQTPKSYSFLPSAEAYFLKSSSISDSFSLFLNLNHKFSASAGFSASQTPPEIATGFFPLLLYLKKKPRRD